MRPLWGRLRDRCSWRLSTWQEGKTALGLAKDGERGLRVRFRLEVGPPRRE